MPGKGFIGNIVQLIGTITLSILARTTLHIASTMTNFIVVKSHSSYNTILGRPTINNLKMITSTYQFKMKFLTTMAVGKVRGKQVLAWECYI